MNPLALTLNQEVVHHMVDKDILTFERMVLTRLAFDPPFAKSVGALLFVDHNGKPARSFKDPRHAAMGHALLHYHKFDSPGKEPSQQLMMHCLQVVTDEGKLAIDEIEANWQYLFTMLQQGSSAWTAVVSVTTMGCALWLGKARNEQISHQSKLERWPLEKTHRELTEEMRFIGGLTRVKNIHVGLWEAFERPQIDTVRRKLSLGHLNTALGGGLGHGEGYLILGASGAGKSVVANQFAAELSMSGAKGIIVTTERSQSASKLMLRIFSSQCRIPYKQIINGFNLSVLSPAQQQDMARLQLQMTKDRFRYVEWFDHPNPGDAQALRDELMRAHDEMGGLDYAVLDWIGGAMPPDVKSDPLKIRLMFQTTADMWARTASDLNIITIATAQVSNAQGKDKARVGIEHAQECKSMDRDMTGVIGISAIRPKGDNGDQLGENYVRDQFLYISKARYGEGALIPVTREFEYQKLVTRTARG
jgi:KaiC